MTPIAQFYSYQHCFKQHFDTRYLVFYNPSPPRIFVSLNLLLEYRIQHVPLDPFMSHLATQFGYSAGGFRLCNWVSLQRLVSWINHLPLACWSTFWKSILSTSWAVGLTYWIVYLIYFLYFDICNYISLDTSYIFLAWSLLLKFSLFFSSPPVLPSSNDVVFVLSTVMEFGHHMQFIQVWKLK